MDNLVSMKGNPINAGKTFGQMATEHVTVKGVGLKPQADNLLGEAPQGRLAEAVSLQRLQVVVQHGGVVEGRLDHRGDHGGH